MANWPEPTLRTDRGTSGGTTDCNTAAQLVITIMTIAAYADGWAANALLKPHNAPAAAAVPRARTANRPELLTRTTRGRFRLHITRRPTIPPDTLAANICQ